MFCIKCLGLGFYTTKKVDGAREGKACDMPVHIPSSKRKDFTTTNGVVLSMLT